MAERTKCYEIIIPAQVGMQSFSEGCAKVRNAMAKQGVGGYVEVPLAQRVMETPMGSRANHAVYIYRVVAGDEAWASIAAVIAAEFYGKAPFAVSRCGSPVDVANG